MVSITAYRRHFHSKLPPRAPPRRWLLPRHTISLNEFRRILRRRAKALSLLPATANDPNFGAILSPSIPRHEQQRATVLEDLKNNYNLDASYWKHDQRKEVEEKLLILSEKKHSLVQALKQILKAEEELKKRNHLQGNHPPLPLQVDVSSNSRSITQPSKPKAGGLHANFTVDKDGQEGGDALNHGQQSFQLLGMDSVPPSADSGVKRFSNNLRNQ